MSWPEKTEKNQGIMAAALAEISGKAIAEAVNVWKPGLFAHGDEQIAVVVAAGQRRVKNLLAAIRSEAEGVGDIALERGDVPGRAEASARSACWDKLATFVRMLGERETDPTWDHRSDNELECVTADLCELFQATGKGEA